MPLDLGTSAVRMQVPLILGPRQRRDAPPRPETGLPLQVALCLVVLALLGAAPAVYLALTDIGVYNSPDETSRYLTARAFAETGRLAIADPVSALPLSGSAGPRGFVQNGGEITTIYPLGHPALVGYAHRIFGEATGLVLSLAPAALMALLGATLWRLRPAAPLAALLVIPAALPIWFWASFVNLDVGIAWAFTAAGLLGWVQALRSRHLPWVVLGSAGFALAALMRHQEAPFLLLLALSFIAGMVWQARSLLRSAAILALYGLPQVALFLWPMALLNEATYGGALTFGNTLFYKELFPERLPEKQGGLSDALGFLKLAFFPQPVDGATMLRGVWFQIFLLSPPLVILGLYGAWTARRQMRAALGPVGVAGIGLSLAYVILSRSDPGVIGAGATAPDLSSSLSRYYWPIYIALALGSGVALAAMGRSLAAALVAGLLALSVYTMWLSPEESIPAWQKLVIAQHDRFAPKIEAATEPDAVIYTGNIDKWLVGSRRVISFWQEGGANYEARSMMDPRRVAADAATIQGAGLPVYFLFRAANGEDLTALLAPLAGRGLGVVWVDRFARGLDLWRVAPLPYGGTVQRLSPEEVVLSWAGFAPGKPPVVERRAGFAGGWYPVNLKAQGSGVAVVADTLGPRPVFYRIAPIANGGKAAELPVLGPVATLSLSPQDDGWQAVSLSADGRDAGFWIASDGTTGNLLRNPSFETGLDAWRGANPGRAGFVKRTTARAAVGDASMQMGMAPSPAGTRIARTLLVDPADLPSAVVSLRAEALVAEACDVHVEMRLIAKDAAGKDLLFANARALDAAGADFAPLVIEGARLPAETASLAIQLTIIARADGATALVFWDAVELRPHDRLPATFLDGDTPGADWSGAPHGSSSALPGGIEAIRVTHAAAGGATPPRSVILTAPARRGDRIEIAGGAVVLRTMRGEVAAEAALPPIAPGDRIEIALKAKGTPALARIATMGDFE